MRIKKRYSVKNGYYQGRMLISECVWHSRLFIWDRIREVYIDELQRKLYLIERSRPKWLKNGENFEPYKMTIQDESKLHREVAYLNGENVSYEKELRMFIE